MIPLFPLIFGISDFNKIAIASFSAFLIIVFNSAYGVINARKQRVMAARVMGASRWRVFRDVLITRSPASASCGCAIVSHTITSSRRRRSASATSSTSAASESRANSRRSSRPIPSS
jgi:ABC-type sulfate transport system permease component